MITTEQKAILLLIEKELTENDGLRFAQVLFNLGINKFADENDPFKKDYLLCDIYNNSDLSILQRIKDRKNPDEKPKKVIETKIGYDFNRNIILNRIKTPDGTILTSHHVHDFVSHLDNNGKRYACDGGESYLKRSCEEPDYEELSVYSDAPFEVVRESFHRGGRGKNGTEELKWTPMDKMSDSWLSNCIIYNEERGQSDSLANKLYKQELDYRKENNILITD